MGAPGSLHFSPRIALIVAIEYHVHKANARVACMCGACGPATDGACMEAQLRRQAHPRVLCHAEPGGAPIGIGRSSFWIYYWSATLWLVMIYVALIA